MSRGFMVEVVFALPHRCWRREVELSEGATAGQALSASGLDAVCRAQCGEEPALGIYGRKVGTDHVMQRGERLELYRALTADPRQRRRADVQARRQHRRREGGVGDEG